MGHLAPDKKRPILLWLFVTLIKALSRRKRSAMLDLITQKIALLDTLSVLIIIKTC